MFEQLKIELEYSLEKHMDIFDRDSLYTLDEMALECMTMDTLCDEDMMYAFGNDDNSMESLYSTEASKVLEKGKRMYFAFATMMKKVFNFLFGFIVNVFKTSVNTKAVMKKNHTVLMKYRKVLLDASNSSKLPDGSIETKDYAGRSVTSLKLLVAIIAATGKAVDVAKAKAESSGVRAAILMSAEYAAMINVICEDNGKYTKPDAVKTTNEEYTQTFLDKVEEAAKKIRDSVVGGLMAMISDIAPKVTTSNNPKDGGKAVASITTVKETLASLTKSADKLADITKAYDIDLKEVEVKYSAIVPYLVKEIDKIDMIIQKNNMDYAKSINTLEKIRSAANKELAKIIPSKDSTDEKPDKKEDKRAENIGMLMEVFNALGSLVSKLTPLVRQLNKNVSSDVDQLATEVTRIVSKMTKI